MTAPAKSPTSTLLRSEFTQLIGKFNGDKNTCEKWSNSLIQAYTEPQRHYHTTTHISSMLSLIQKYQNLITNHTIVQLALYFHDWVYDPKAHDNELQSIAVFRTFAAELKLPPNVKEKVCHYIEASIAHTLSPEDEGDEDLKLFLDLDLEVLGRAKEEYEVYARQIREEYGHFNQQDYAKGRLGVLEKFLGRERLYFTESVGAELEEQARWNLGAEIEGLQARLASLTWRNVTINQDSG